MNSRILICITCVTIAVGLAGCVPRTLVKKNPGPNDTGVRYYRPKPYLMVTPMSKSDGTPVDGMVTISIEMLPDFSEEYSIHVQTGLGANKTSISLDEGWNLTQINVDADSNFDENVKAVADLVSKVPTLTGGPNALERNMNVSARNIPIGLYESVIGEGPDCKKQLYGFRYVGFLPYASCPTTMMGGDAADCESGVIYGLFFKDGSMVFEPLKKLE